MKSANMRYCNSGVISHEVCNHEIFWLWCNISSNLNPWDTGYWTYIYRYDILDSVIQSIIQGQSNQFINLGNNSNQSNQSIKTADQTSASPYSFAVFFVSLCCCLFSFCLYSVCSVCNLDKNIVQFGQIH